MNKFATFLASFGTVIFASGQITLDQNNVPHSDNHSDIRALNTTGVTIPAHGTNVLYDYSSLANTAIDTIPYIDATRTGFTAFTRFNYGYSTLNAFQLYSEYYTHKFNDGIARVGSYKLPESFSIGTITGGTNDELTFTGNNSVFVNPGYEVKFPSTYGTTWSSTYRFETDFELTVAAFSLASAPGQQRQNVTQTDSVVGWGQLRLPTLGGVSILYDVLLMKQSLNYIDSVFLGGSPAPAQLLAGFGLTQGQTGKVNKYVFYAAGFERPLLIIEMSDNWQTVERSYHTANGLATIGIEELGELNGLNVYPNPAVQGGTVLFANAKNAPAADLWIFDAAGNPIHRSALSNANGTTLEWTVPTNFKQGMYIYQLWQNGDCHHGKLVIH
jgi:hypothetical protein